MSSPAVTSPVTVDARQMLTAALRKVDTRLEPESLSGVTGFGGRGGGEAPLKATRAILLPPRVICHDAAS